MISRFGPRVCVGCFAIFLVAAAPKPPLVPLPDDPVPDAPPDGRSVVIAAADASGRVVPMRYWADYGRNTIRRRSLDGSSIEEVASGLSGPYGLGFDAGARLFLWTSSADEVVQAASLDGFAPTVLESSFEDSYALVVESGDSEIAYAVLDGALVKLTQDRKTGAEQREVLLYLESPDSVRGLALSPDHGTLYIGDAVGQMSRKLRLSDRVVETIAFAGGAPPVLDPEPADAGQEPLQ
jgi:hypothetical protein